MSRRMKSLQLVGFAVAFWTASIAHAQEGAASTDAPSDAAKTPAAVAGEKKPTSAAPTPTEQETEAAQPAGEGEGSDSAPGAQPTAGGGASASAPAASGEAPGSAPGAAQEQPAAEASMDGATYRVRLRDLEQRVDELKEQIRRSHTRLSLLSDTILSGGVGGARAEIEFVNEMSTAFRMTEAVFVLDGAVQYKKQDETGALSEQERIPIFNGSIPAGDHTLQVLIKLRGHGYGVFSYLRGYNFEVRSDHSFTVTDGKTIALTAVGYESGGATTPLEERPAIRYVENIRAIGEAPSQPAPTRDQGGVGGAINVGGGSVSGSGGTSVGGGE